MMEAVLAKRWPPVMRTRGTCYTQRLFCYDELGAVGQGGREGHATRRWRRSQDTQPFCLLR